MFRFAIATIFSAGVIGVATAQAYPGRAVRVMVPAAPGGGTAILERLPAPQGGAVQQRQEAFGTALQSHSTRDRLTAEGVDVVAGSPEELAVFLEPEMPKRGAVARAAHLEADG